MRKNRIRTAFTLVELLVVIAIISILAAILFPVFGRAKEAAKKSSCLANQRQILLALTLYTSDSDDALPDRRDIKRQVGAPITWTFPASDPRAGWATVVLDSYIRSSGIWKCPSVDGSSMGRLPQVLQTTSVAASDYWMWRFDHSDPAVIELDNFWGKTPEQCVADLQTAKNPQAGTPNGTADVEMIVDPYFPNIKTVDVSLRGLAVHMGGRNRGMLDGHVKWLRDIRLNP